MYLLIVIFPLFGSLIVGFLGRFLGRYGASIFATACVLHSLFLSILAFYEVGVLENPCYLTLMPWIISGIFSLS